jgi:hypothetical protein
MLPDLNLIAAFFADQLLKHFSTTLAYQYATLAIFIPAFSGKRKGLGLYVTDYKKESENVDH